MSHRAANDRSVGHVWDLEVVDESCGTAQKARIVHAL
jgi:hypothetical protein